MNKIWLHSIRAYLRLALFFYYKRIILVNVKHIPKDTPVLLLGNHQNALIDALLIAVYGNGRFFYFLTRASVFKRPVVAKILKSLRMLPVFRVRDGWSSIANNSEIFNSCSTLLDNKAAIAVFPEGNHSLKRTVRPLSKGFTRIVFETLEKYPETNLHLVPMGFNYKHAEKYPDKVSLHFGAPIVTKDFCKANKHEATSQLKSTIQERISELTAHIPVDGYADSIDKLNNLEIDFLKPDLVNQVIKNNLYHKLKVKKTQHFNIGIIFKILLIIELIVPFAIWKLIIQPKIKEAEFTATFRFAVAITLVPFYILITAILLATNVSLKIAVLFVLSTLINALASSKL